MITRETFDTLLSNLELSATLQDTISTRHTSVREYVENQLTHARTQLIGSLQKKTRIHPRVGDTIDIDILLILGDFTRWAQGGITPQQTLETGNLILEGSRRYNRMNPSIDAPTVSMEGANDIKIEIVPAYVDRIGYDPRGLFRTVVGRGFWVPQENGSWGYADYNHDANVISSTNQTTGGLLVPTIKLLKAIKREHFPAMKSFQLEVLAANWIPTILAYFQQNGIEASYLNIVRAFFAWTSEVLNTPVGLRDSRSPQVSNNPQYALEHPDVFRRVIAHIDSIRPEISEADKHAQWRILFGDVFPAR